MKWHITAVLELRGKSLKLNQQNNNKGEQGEKNSLYTFLKETTGSKFLLFLRFTCHPLS